MRNGMNISGFSEIVHEEKMLAGIPTLVMSLCQPSICPIASMSCSSS